MVTNLREAKGRLSELVQRAASGEDVVITVRGQPLARLTGLATRKRAVSNRGAWMAATAAASAAAQAGGSASLQNA
jgi:prevent-host-death family protein